MQRYSHKSIVKYRLIPKEKAYIKTTAIFLTVVAVVIANFFLKNLSDLKYCTNASWLKLFIFSVFFLIIFLYYKLSIRLQKTCEGVLFAIVINITSAALILVTTNITISKITKPTIGKKPWQCHSTVF